MPLVLSRLGESGSAIAQRDRTGLTGAAARRGTLAPTAPYKADLVLSALLSRAIRLDVSQRVPPMRCTSE